MYVCHPAKEPDLSISLEKHRKACLPIRPSLIADREHRHRHCAATMTSILTSRSLHLGCGTLGALLACDPCGLAPCSAGGGLGLLSLLLRLGGGLLLLALLDGGSAGCGAGLGALGAALLDHVEGGTDDGALVLDGAAGALLGSLL